jgi:hypothetical protein
MPVYYTHSNGERPFEVEVSNGSITVWGEPPDYDCLAYQIPSYDKLFVGKSRKRNALNARSNSYGKRFDGNSLLVKVGDTRYVHVGREIYAFTTSDDITGYYSSVDGDDVPHPYAVGKNRVFLLSEYVSVPKSELYGDIYWRYFKGEIEDVKSLRRTNPVGGKCRVLSKR